MVLKSLFKSKEEKEKDKKRKSIKQKLDAVPSGGRSNNATKLKLKRDLKALDKPKTERPKSGGRASTAYGTKHRYEKNNQGNKVKVTNKKKTTGSSTFVTKNGKRYLKSSPMGKKIIADQKRQSLGSKNYMTKEMIAKRKKRLKIKK